MQTTYKVGDKVRILDASKISNAVRDGFKTGGIYNVKRINSNGRPVLEHESDILAFWQDELQYIEKVEESDAKMTQFKVGDKVKYVSGPENYYTIGKVYEVLETVEDYYRISDNKGNRHSWTNVTHDRFELVESKPTKKQRIATLEQKVEAMQAEIEALKATQSIGKTAEAIVKAIEKHTPKSANEKRKAIIDEAKAFVEDITDRMRKYGHGNTLGGHGKITTEARGYILRANFVVNPEKRTVVALVIPFYMDDKDVKSKGIAKCAPDDVFNADIGKAIALGRALGLDAEQISKFEKAEQPSEVVYGMVVRGTGNGFYSASRTFTINGEKRKYDAFYYEEAKQYGGGDNDWISRNQIGVILDDTEAQY